MKIQVNTEDCLYIELNGWTYYIDDSTNEQIIDKWMNIESIEHKLNKKFIKGSFFRSLPLRVQNSFKKASNFSHYDIDFCNVSESEGINFISGNINYLRRFPKIGNVAIQSIRDCLKKWKESHQEELLEEEYDPNVYAEMEANEGEAIREYENNNGERNDK